MHQLIRITSTYVENTVWTNPPIGCPQDHLHIRGEYLKIINLQVMLKGSPPHTWRILTFKKWINSGRMDHLHIRGEYPIGEILLAGLLGSPPHTWRIQIDNLLPNHWVGITSTYVENTDWAWTSQTQSWDHLHIRGEYSRVCFTHWSRQGSPPHTWRILEMGRSSNLKFRITSTYVENT